jgi:hypothetical protein
MTVAVASLIGIGLLTLLVYNVFLSPYQKLQEELKTALEEKAKKDKELTDFNAKKKHLERVRAASFPVSARTWLTEYDKYLRDLGKDLKELQVTPPTNVAEPKPTTGAGKKVQAGEIRRSWTMRGKGSWQAIMTMLEKFEHTPFLHRIKSITVERTDSADKKDKEYVDELLVNLTVETLSMMRGDKRSENLWGYDDRLFAVDALGGLGLGTPGLMRGLNAFVLLPRGEVWGRSYDKLEARNPFRGGDPYEYKVPTSETIDKIDVRKFTFLNKIERKTEEITVVVVKTAGIKTAQPKMLDKDGPAYPTVPFDPDSPTVEVAVDKSKKVEVAIHLNTITGDHRADLIESVVPARGGVRAEIKNDGNLNIIVDKNAVAQTYKVKIKVERALLRNKLVEGNLDNAYSLPLSLKALVSAGKGSFFPPKVTYPYTSFVVRSIDEKNDQANGTLVRVDETEIYFHVSKEQAKYGVKEGIYCLHMGESVYDCLVKGKPLSPAELYQLDWWSMSPLKMASTMGLLGSPGAGSLPSVTFFPDRPGMGSLTKPPGSVTPGDRPDRITKIDAADEMRAALPPR